MLLYVIRHADALQAVEDPQRPLSARGHDQVARLAEFFRANRALQSVTAFWHSPLVRARETAEGLARGLKLDVPLIETPGLQSEDLPHAVAAHLTTLTESVALVGHEPHLSALATLLVCGAPNPTAFIFKQADVLALQNEHDIWRVQWNVGADLLPPAPAPLPR